MLEVEHIITSGTFSLDGEDFDVDNNVWIVGDDQEVVIIDAAHDAEAIVDATAGRKVKAILCTHGHNDHINAAVELSETTKSPIYLHPDDSMLWQVVHAEHMFDTDLSDRASITVGGGELTVYHTPGHSPGGCCFHAPDAGVVFSGDTLFRGGPGATGRSFSSYGLLVDSIEKQLFSLPGHTTVHTGHGDSTSIEAELPSLSDWKAKLSEPEDS